MAKNIYVVNYASYCVRDTQVWINNPDEIEPLSDDWVDLGDSPNVDVFVGIFEADNFDDAIRKAAAREMCDPECVVAHCADETQV